MGKEFWLEYWERVKAMAFGFDWSYVVEIIAFAAAFYIAFKILKENNCPVCRRRNRLRLGFFAFVRGRF